MDFKKATRTEIANIFFEKDQNPVSRLLQTGLEYDDPVDKTFSTSSVHQFIVKQKCESAVAKAESQAESKFNKKFENYKKTTDTKHKSALKNKSDEISKLKKEINKAKKENDSLQSELEKEREKYNVLREELIKEQSERMSVADKLDLKFKMIKIEKEFYNTFKVKENIVSNLDLFCNKAEMEEHFAKILSVLREKIFNMKFTMSNVLKNRDSKFIREELDKEFKKIFNSVKNTKFNPPKKSTSVDSLFESQLDEDMKDIKKKVYEYELEY